MRDPDMFGKVLIDACLQCLEIIFSSDEIYPLPGGHPGALASCTRNILANVCRQTPEWKRAYMLVHFA